MNDHSMEFLGGLLGCALGVIISSLLIALVILTVGG